MQKALSLAALVAALLTGSTLLAQAPAGGAQAGAPPTPAPMTNLQFFPKDTPRAQVLQQMQGFTQALGVQCSHCHVREDTDGRNDMAADEKATKRTARQMLMLVRDLNTRIPVAVGKSAETATRIECMTCHRGVAIPKQLGDIMTEAVAASGMPAAVAKYRELRTRYYGAMPYDFSEGGLITFANRMAMAKPDEALQWLELNLEFNPKSARSHLAMAQIYNRKSDKASATRSVEQALALDPQNAQAKTLLENLKK